MRKRSKMPAKASKANFTRNSGSHPKNVMGGSPMRGGIRL